MNRVWHQDREVAALKRQLAKAETDATSITAQLDGMPGQPSKDPHHKVEHPAIIAEQICEMIEGKYYSMSETLAVIKQVEDPDARTLLMMRYINCEKWEAIGETLGYTYPYRGVYKLRKKALRMCEPFIEKLIEADIEVQ